MELTELFKKSNNPDHPERWQRALRNREVRRYILEHKRFKIVHAAGRAFKTYVAKRHLIAETLKNPNHAYFVAGPTFNQTKRVWWEDLKSMIPKWAILAISETDLCITLRNNTELWITSFETPERIEGKRGWHGCVIDEADNLRHDNWFKQIIVPALSDTRGWMVAIGRSRQTHTVLYKELAKIAASGTDQEFGEYSWGLNAITTPEEEEYYKALLDESTYAQEFGGKFVEKTGLAYPYFQRDAHMKEIPPQFQREFFISADFNLNPCVWEFGQVQDNSINFLDEIVDRQTDVYKMIGLTKKLLIRWFGDEQRAKGKRVVFVGDYTSTARHDTAAIESTWQIIEQEFQGWNVAFDYQSNPKVFDRVNAVNGRLRSADGKTHLTVSSRCKMLLEDFDAVTTEMLFEKKAQAGDRTHASDCCGYAICTLIVNVVKWIQS